MSALDEALATLAREVARAVVAELRSGETSMIDQSASPLGRRRHIEAVRRRVAAGEPGAAVVGRKYLLSRDALDAELGTLAKKPRKAKPVAVDELADLRKRYDLRRAS